MSTQTLLRAATALLGLNVVLTGVTYNTTRTNFTENSENFDARMDEVEGTLRGHVGLIEESLERIEGIVAKSAGKESGWGKGMGKKAEDMYSGSSGSAKHNESDKKS